MNNVNLFFGFLILSLCISGCKKKPTKGSILSKSTNANYFVSKESALKFARHMDNQLFFSKEDTKKHISTPTEADSNDVGLLNTITNYFTINDSLGQPALYVINYEVDSGYIIISADYRYEPICAYAGLGNLYATDTIPSMLGSWFGRTVENIEMLRYGGYINGDAAALEWQYWNELVGNIIHVRKVYVPEPTDPCINPITPVIVQPLLGNLVWGQGCTFNNLCPIQTNCHQLCNYNNQHAVAGCVAVSVAQLIRYWEYPSNYNYASMPDNYGNYDVQDLIHDAGVSVNTNYGCESSSAGGLTTWLFNTSHIPNALQNTFNYSSATYDNNFSGNDRWIITNNLDAGKPVLLGGFESQINLWLFAIPQEGHEWVCDGYKLHGTVCYKHLWFHMNWGWNYYGSGTGFNNGWYYWDNWNVAGHNYQNCQSFVYNIQP